jgi:hypothetical protein
MGITVLCGGKIRGNGQQGNGQGHDDKKLRRSLEPPLPSGGR